MIDQTDVTGVAIVGDAAAAQTLAADLGRRGVDAVVRPPGAPPVGGARYTVSFDPEAAGEAPGLRDGDRFFAGAAARPDLADAALARDDAANLGWKLALVLRGAAPAALLDSYENERAGAAPDTAVDYAASPLTSQFGIDKKFRGGPAPGSLMIDAQVALAGQRDVPVPLADQCGDGFAALFFTGDYAELPAPLAEGLRGLQAADVPLKTIVVTAAEAAVAGDFPLVIDPERALHRRYGAMTGAFYLVRPDAVIAARWQHPSIDAIAAALKRATGHTDASSRPARSSGW